MSTDPKLIDPALHTMESLLEALSRFDGPGNLWLPSRILKCSAELNSTPTAREPVKVTEAQEQLQLVESVLKGYAPSIARNDALNTIAKLMKTLATVQPAEPGANHYRQAFNEWRVDELQEKLLPGEETFDALLRRARELMAQEGGR